MRKEISRYEREKKSIDKKIEKIDQKIRFLLEEPRGEVAGLLNEVYEEKFQLVDRLQELDERIELIKSKKFEEQVQSYKVKVDGKTKKVHLVEEGMVNPREGLISANSPLGVALQGKQSGDSFQFSTPLGNKTYQVL